MKPSMDGFSFENPDNNGCNPRTTRSLSLTPVPPHPRPTVHAMGPCYPLTHTPEFPFTELFVIMYSRDFLFEVCPSTSLYATTLPPQNLKNRAPDAGTPCQCRSGSGAWSSHLRMGGGGRADRLTWYKASNSVRVQQEPPAACRWQQ